MGKKKIDIELNVKAKKAAKDLKTVDKGLTGIGKAGKMAGGGFKVMGTAMKAAGIGIIVTLFGKLVEVLMKNQKFMDAMNKIFLALEPILMAVAEVISIVVEGLANLIGTAMSAAGATNKLTAGLVDQRKKVQLLEAELGLLQLQYQREAELMRQIRDDESLSIDERINANRELGKVLEEQLEHERSIAMESLRLAEIELAINKDNIELQVALTEAKTKMAEIDERITGQRSEQLVNLNSLEREREAQQKEAAQAREEQLKKEAEMLQDLIDLQNEDILVKKKANKDLSTQFENAEEANKAQLEFLEEQKQAELDALEARKKNAKQNIANQKESIEGYNTEIEEREKADADRMKNFKKVAAEELELFAEMSTHANTTHQNDALKKNKFYKEQVLAGLMESNIENEEQLAEFVTNYKKTFGDLQEDFENFSGNQSAVIQSMGQHHDRNLVKIDSTVDKILTRVGVTGEAITDITEEQIESSEKSMANSVSIIDGYADEKIAIEKKYAQEAEDVKKSLDDTTLTLQEQADEALFLHFETAKEKEIRLAEEKYDKLIGLAEGNAEATEELEQQKADAIKKIHIKEAKVLAKNFLEEMKLRKAKAKAKKDLEVTAAQETFAMAVGLAQEGTAAYKVLASAETIMATRAAATKALDDIPSPWNFVQAGLIIATGMKNLAEIQKTKVPGGGGGGGQTMGSTDIGGGVGGDMTGGVPSITFGDAGSNVPPVQAFVVETDISNAQALQSELDLQSTL
jgi:hypothetical protein